jgi:hypothetical protein
MRSRRRGGRIRRWLSRRAPPEHNDAGPTRRRAHGGALKPRTAQGQSPRRCRPRADTRDEPPRAWLVLQPGCAMVARSFEAPALRPFRRCLGRRVREAGLTTWKHPPLCGRSSGRAEGEGFGRAELSLRGKTGTAEFNSLICTRALTHVSSRSDREWMWHKSDSTRTAARQRATTLRVGARRAACLAAMASIPGDHPPPRSEQRTLRRAAAGVRAMAVHRDRLRALPSPHG